MDHKDLLNESVEAVACLPGKKEDNIQYRKLTYATKHLEDELELFVSLLNKSGETKKAAKLRNIIDDYHGRK